MKKFICIICLTVLPYGAVAQDQAEEDKGYLTRLIEDNLSGDDRIVDIQGFQGALSSRASLTSMTIADSEGVWLTLEDVTLDWSRTALLRGVIDIQELSAAQIIVERAPLPAPSAPPTPEAQPFSLPELPVSISLEQLDIARIELGESFLGERIALSLTGAASLAGGEGSANVTAQRQDGQTGTFIIDGSYDNSTNVLGLNLNVEEGEGGIVAKLVNLPGQPSLALTVEGTAPLSEYAATLALATDGQDRINGDFALNSTEGQTGYALNIGGDLTPLLAPEYQGFFGPDVTLTAAGARSENGGFALSKLDLSAESLRLQGQVTVSPDGWPELIDITGNVSSPAGAVLLPIGGPQTLVANVDLAISYDQSVSTDWTANFDIDGFERPGLTIGNINLGGGGVIIGSDGTTTGRFTADMAYRATGLALDDTGAAQAFGDTLDGQIVLDRTEGQPTNITALTLNGPGIEVSADATIQSAEESFATQTNILFSAEALSRFSTLAGRDLAGSADATIIASMTPLDGLFDVLVTAQTQDLAVGVDQLDPLLAGQGDVSLEAARDTTGTRLRGLRITTPELTATADADITSGASTGNLAMSIRETSLIAEGLNGPAQITGRAAATDAGIITFTLDGTGPATTLAANGTVTPQGDGSSNGRSIDATVIAEVTDLALYRALTGRDLNGAVAFEATGNLLTDDTRFNVTFDGTTQDLQVGVAQVDPLLEGAGTLSGRVAATGGDRYAIDDLNVQTPHLRLNANGAGGVTGPLSADANLTIENMARIANGLDGPLNLDLNAARDAAGVSDVQLTANGPGIDLKVDTAIASADQNYRITGLIDAMVAELRPYTALAEQDITGGVDLRVNGSLLPDLSLFDVTLDGTTRSVSVGVEQVDNMLAGPGRISGGVARTAADQFTLTDFTATTPQISLAGSADGGMTGPLTADISATINDAGALAQGLNGPLRINLNADRTDGTGSADVTLTANGSGTDVALDATIAPETEDYQITGTLNASVANLVQFRALAGQPLSGGLTVNAAGSLLPDLSRFDVQADVRSSNIGIGNAQVDQLISGTGNASLDATRGPNGIAVRRFELQFPQVSASGSLNATDGGAANGTFQARLANVGLFIDALSGPVTAQGDLGRTAGGDFRLNIDAAGPGGINAIAAGTIGAGGNLNLTVNGGAPLALANTFIAPRSLDGDATFDLAINGPPAVSSVSGQLALNNGRLAAPSLGQALDRINGTVRLAGNAAQIDITAQVQAGGSLSINGPVGLAAPFNGDLTITANGVTVQDPNLYSTTIDGAIGVNGPLTGGAVIAGVLNLGETNIQVPSSGTSALGDLPDVTHLNASDAVRQTLQRAEVEVDPSAAAQDAGPAGPAFPLDITVNAPNRIFIRGRGLDAELGGSLSLGGTTANIVPVGNFELVRGRLTILQQRFDLTEGSASLQGDFIPFIRLVATTRSEGGTTINIIVEGPATEPVVTFQSSPSLPQDEVLSQLIFGRDISKISPLQAVQLAAAVGTLAGRGGGGLIDSFRSNIGLDDFDVTTDENGNAAVRAGKYLSDNIYTDITIGSDGTTEINLNLDVTDEITAKGTAGADGDNSIGLFFERDY